MGNILKKYNLTKAQWEVVGGAITGDTLPIGSMIPYTSKTTPSNWLPCNGQAVSRTTYADLFAIIGTQYGAGDGSTTFNVPDLNDYKVPIGYDRFEEQSSRMNLGTTGGEETHTLTVGEMPSHNHIGGSLDSGSEAQLDWAYGKGSQNAYVLTSSTGGGQPHNNMQPYVTTNYIIKAFQSAGVVAQVSNTKSDSTTDTYSCDYVNKLNTYSTTETVIGTWVNENGSKQPLYRKVINGTTPSTEETWGSIGEAPSDISVKNMNGMIGGYLPVPSYINSNYYVALQKAGNIIQAYVKGYTNNSVSITLIYTKAADITTQTVSDEPVLEEPTI